MHINRYWRNTVYGHDLAYIEGLLSRLWHYHGRRHARRQSVGFRLSLFPFRNLSGVGSILNLGCTIRSSTVLCWNTMPISGHLAGIEVWKVSTWSAILWLFGTCQAKISPAEEVIVDFAGSIILLGFCGKSVDEKMIYWNS
jgi:hypothetical protein